MTKRRGSSRTKSNFHTKVAVEIKEDVHLPVEMLKTYYIYIPPALKGGSSNPLKAVGTI